MVYSFLMNWSYRVFLQKITVDWEHAILAPFDDRNNAFEVDVGPPKEPHKYSSTDEKTEELGRMNEYHEVSNSDLTNDEFMRSLMEEQIDIHADRLSRDTSLFMDKHSRDSTINTVDGSKKETNDNESVLPNTRASNEGTIYGNFEIPDMMYEGILFEFNH